MVDVRTDRRGRRTGAQSGRRQYRHRESENQWHHAHRYGLIRTRARNSPRAYMFCAERWARVSGARFAEAPGETRRRSQEEDDMTRARRFAVGIIALVAIGVVPVFAAEPVFEGVYIAHGIDSDGTHY